ncbi:MAG: transcription-repair coupling factor [Planctomycetota bacterium]
MRQGGSPTRAPKGHFLPKQADQYAAKRDAWLGEVARSGAVRTLADRLAKGERSVARGLAGSSGSALASSVARELLRPVVLILAHLDDADEAVEELESAGVSAVRLSAPDPTGSNPELLAERLASARAVVDLARDEPSVIVTSIQALMHALPPIDEFEQIQRIVRPGERLDPQELARWLAEGGYERHDTAEEPGQFAVRGGIIDVFAPGAPEPVRLDFFGDELDKLTAVDLETLGSDRALDAAELTIVDPGKRMVDLARVPPVDLLPVSAPVLLVETLELVEQARGWFERATEPAGLLGPPTVLASLEQRSAGLAEINQYSPGADAAGEPVELPVQPLGGFNTDASEAIDELQKLCASSDVLVCCQNQGEADRFRELAEGTDAMCSVAYVHRGFIWSEPGARPYAVIPYHELIGRFTTRRRVQRLRAGRAMDTFLGFAPGDFVVHADHGIAKFIGLQIMRPERLSANAAKPTGPKDKTKEPDPAEFLTLEFAGGGRLHVPCTQIDLVQRYVGGFSGKPPLSTLGGKRWQGQKDKVAESVRDLAAEMLRVRAAREHTPGVQYPSDTKWQTEFEAEFPYQETDDQLASLAEIKRDMTSARPMDRLLCGDVGFGKTELAIRAAFKAVEYGRQVAVLVPTTVLAEQHERTFRSRFADYPFKVESLSRFKTAKEINDVLARLRKGMVDVVIGTHRLLSKDVRFSDLGLVVVDEEQRFGVEHKERLLQLRATVDVLTLSATPIPRTLHMSMLGLRDISSLTTPPADRRAVVTEVIHFNKRRIRSAIERELAREGQIYYVHNRVHNILRVRDDIQTLVPDARIVVGHGQMPPKELEQVMLAFMRREADVLLSTTIIESGIDIPTANTMLINDADRFGLADLHQLRGRVGRHKHRAYCYLLLPPDRPIREVARKRLKAIEQHSSLGSGFRIAMRDLEIRGAGNLLGAEQSGHIATVGYDMYCRLLEQEVKHLKNEQVTAPPSATAVELGLSPGIIPRPFIPNDQRRMDAYRRIATARDSEGLQGVESDLVAAYGDLPKPVEHLLRVARLRAACAAVGVKAVSIRPPDVVFRCEDGPRVTGALAGIKGTVKALPPKSHDSAAEVYWRPPASYLEGGSLLSVLLSRLSA